MATTSAKASRPRLGPHLPSLVPGLLIAALFVDWAVQDGGYDPSTWYWGALLVLGALPFIVLQPQRRRSRLRRETQFALIAFALYVAWSYLSITWAQSPGDALQGSNRALLYLLLFAAMAVLPWTRFSAVAVLLAFVAGIGVVAFVFLARLSDADRVGAIVVNGRLEAPTGYFNASVALFTMTALLAVALATRRTLPAPIRGLLLGVAAAGLQLSVTGESRGWLFTLPLVLLTTMVVVRDRIRFIIAAVLPTAATVIVAHRLIGLYDAHTGAAIDHAARQAGGASLRLCVVTVGLGTLLAAADQLLRRPPWLMRARRMLGAIVVVLALAAGATGTLVATHGHPVSFVTRQWDGFSHPEQTSTAGSRFDVVGSGRYDFWRVALDAFASHPIGGLGQDNFADYYLPRGHTDEEPAWTHSLEMRLLAMTGIVGTLLFAAFLVLAIRAAVRRKDPDAEVARWAARAAMLPFLVWLIHGSIDWFWEMPALAGPALGFLAMAGSLGNDQAAARRPVHRLARPAAVLAGVTGLLAATVVLTFPYLSVVEQSRAERELANPIEALRDLKLAAELDPLSAVPGRTAGEFALEQGLYEVALGRFDQATVREPGGWFGWLGAGLAASELGEVPRARHDFRVALSIDDKQPAISTALARVGTAAPLPASEALQMLLIVQ